MLSVTLAVALLIEGKCYCGLPLNESSFSADYGECVILSTHDT